MVLKLGPDFHLRPHFFVQTANVDCADVVVGQVAISYWLPSNLARHEFPLFPMRSLDMSSS